MICDMHHNQNDNAKERKIRQWMKRSGKRGREEEEEEMEIMVEAEERKIRGSIGRN